MWIGPNAWREVLSRIFAGFKVLENFTPEWLINPETNRRLKLDFFYPEVGIAVRFQGLQSRQQRQRPTEKELRQQETRDAARTAICEAHEVSLVTIEAVNANPRAILGNLRAALARAAQRLKRGRKAGGSQQALASKVARAQEQLEIIARQVRRPEDMAVYAELWEDRLYAVPEPSRSEATAPPTVYAVGMSVRHATFGLGQILTLEPDGADTFVTVRFADGTERKFAASLVRDKLTPQRNDPASIARGYCKALDKK
jgi:hypothetical protein